VDKMNREQAIEDVCLIARNAIDRILELEHKRNKKWVGLTDEELFKCSYDADDREDAMRAVEACLKEKNG
jgi:hypothetical protein